MRTRSSGHDQTEPTSVYVLICGGFVKIGIAAKVSARVEHRQLAGPMPIEVAFERQFQTRTNARLVERSLHARFGAQRLHGEWFDMAPGDAIAALQAAEETAQPVTIPGRLKATPAALPRPVATPRPFVARRDSSDGPTWDEYNAMDEDTWIDFMRPAAATLDFTDPDANQKARALEAELRTKHPQYFGRVPA